MQRLSVVDFKYSADHDPKLDFPHFSAGHVRKHTLQ